MAQSLLRLPQVVARCGYRRSSIYAMIRRGEFPAPIELGPRLKVWPSDSIDTWVEERIQSARIKRSGAERNQPIAAAV